MNPIFPHGDLTELAPGLWQITGSLGRSPIPRNMVVYRLPDGGLLLHSVVALDEAGMAALEKLGRPALMVVPNGMHRADAAWYKARYPEIEVVCPRASRRRVERVTSVEGDAETRLPELGVACHSPAGIRSSELTYELALDSGRALVFTDLLFNLAVQPGFSGRLTQVIGSSGFFGITRIGRWLMLKDRTAFRDWLLEMAAAPEPRVICVAHGEAITSDCGGRLKAAAARLGG